MPTKTKRALVYARLSVANDESISIDRQIESCSKYADSQGWELAGVFKDDGVSATHNKPEDRAGWKQLLAVDERFDVVIVWKIDRLARRVLDFLHADETLQQRRAAVVSATEPIDMTTGTGRAFATMLAVFAQMEAEAISARVKSARDYLVKRGRVVGGPVPYGYRSVPNPDGPGFVLVQDVDNIQFVAEAARRALSGETVYGIKQWLSAHAPLPTVSQANRKHAEWSYSTVERLLRNPILAGMTPYNPGNMTKERGHDVLRGDNGLPVVNGSLAVITTEERRTLLAILDADDKPQRRPRASRMVTPSVLAGLATCGDCSVIMHRGTTEKRPMLYCPKCHQTISMNQLLPHLESRLLDERGDEQGIELVQDFSEGDQELADIEDAIRDVTSKMTLDDADVPRLVDQLEGLKELRSRTRETPTPRYIANIHKLSVSQEWQAATSDEQRRAVLMWQMQSLTILRGKVGRYLDPSRVSIKWRPAKEYDDAMSELTAQMSPGDLYTEG